MLKVIEVKLPDGKRFFSDNCDLEYVTKAAKKYLKDHNMDSSNRPLTEFTIHEMTEEEYRKLGGTQEATDFWNCKENTQ